MTLMMTLMTAVKIATMMMTFLVSIVIEFTTLYCVPNQPYMHIIILYPCISPTIQQGKFRELKYSRISHHISLDNLNSPGAT